MIGLRSIVLALATTALVAGVLVLVVDGSPGRGSPEVGYLHDMLTHDENALTALGVLAEGDLTPSERALFTDLDGLIRDSNEEARMLLSNWGVTADERDRPIAWMGHLVPGATPGQIGASSIDALEATPEEDRVEQLVTLLFRHSRGAVLMSRGALNLASNTDATDFAAEVARERNEAVADIEQWFVERNRLPPTWLAFMTADPGELDHGDPIGSLADLLGSAVEWVALSLGVLGLSWLAMRQQNSNESLASRLCVLGAAFSALSGLGHLGLARSHFEQAAISGLFFVVAGLAGLVVAAALVARPSAETLNLAATKSVVLIVVFAFFRFIPPPGSIGAADVNLAGLVLVGLQLGVFAIWATRPFGEGISSWGVDSLLVIMADGARAGVLSMLLVLFTAVGYLVGEADAWPPSEVDVGFAQDMSMHHEQAVRLAQSVDDRLDSRSVDTFRSEVVIFQTEELGRLRDRLLEWGSGPPDDLVMEWMGMDMPLEEMPGVVSEAQFEVIEMADGPELDEMFLTLLGAHHVGGVQMAEFAADNADDPILRDLAAAIARNQRIEISEYDATMDGLGYETSPGSLSMSELAVLSILASQT